MPIDAHESPRPLDRGVKAMIPVVAETVAERPRLTQLIEPAEAAAGRREQANLCSVGLAHTTAAVRVTVHASDEILSAGVIAHLRNRPEVRLVTRADESDSSVAVVVTDQLDDDAILEIRRLSRAGGTHVVLVAADPSESDLVTAIEAGALALLRRREANADRLVTAILGAVVGEGVVPADLLGRLLAQVGEVQRGVLCPPRLNRNGLSEREVEVLRLVADGCDTAEIASTLAYSERTIKNVLHDVTSRLGLRNRTQAVAYALRQGLI